MAIKQSITINKAVTLLPILILIVVSLVQGYIRYSHDIETAINHRVELAKVSAQPILNLMNRSVGGGNYANLQDVEALNLFKANKDIDFFSVQGKTDAQGKDFAALYDAKSQILYRTIYSDDYLSSRQKKLEKIDATLKTLPQGHVSDRNRIFLNIILTEREFDQHRAN
ncbi:hypothetical protein [sulfur-oxidizing endosymbiont of Gigantopelta aegis]|uniref:hypothetical protein n=1 Tax=sulfur-oxidizing endosymbiont of Gigantopelta aegis TaxID=2794934 RepID=UPI0018DE8639|nr:hypothetical protein [sulfur-oxidizing endosymbiont of Gigantopelta aegis]